MDNKTRGFLVFVCIGIASGLYAIAGFRVMLAIVAAMALIIWFVIEYVSMVEKELKEKLDEKMY